MDFIRAKMLNDIELYLTIEMAFLWSVSIMKQYFHYLAGSFTQKFSYTLRFKKIWWSSYFTLLCMCKFIKHFELNKFSLLHLFQYVTENEYAVWTKFWLQYRRWHEAWNCLTLIKTFISNLSFIQSKNL